ncbi:MAG: discoidin domain-containing protein [Fibrobacterales bacterium]
MKLLTTLKAAAITLALTATVTSAQNFELVSGGATVTASSTESYLYEVSNLTDGDDGSRWASVFQNNQEVIVDLGETTDIQKVVLKWEAAYASYYKLQFSHDQYSWTTGISYTNAGGDGGVDEITQDFGDYRFMKVILVERSTQYGFSLYEVEVYTESVAPHLTAQSLTLAKYDNTSGGSPLEICTEDIVGKVVVSRTGHYSLEDRVMVCLGASTPVTSMRYGWVVIGSGTEVPQQ